MAAREVAVQATADRLEVGFLGRGRRGGFGRKYKENRRGDNEAFLNPSALCLILEHFPRVGRQKIDQKRRCLAFQVLLNMMSLAQIRSTGARGRRKGRKAGVHGPDCVVSLLKYTILQYRIFNFDFHGIYTLCKSGAQFGKESRTRWAPKGPPTFEMCTSTHVNFGFSKFGKPER